MVVGTSYEDGSLSTKKMIFGEERFMKGLPRIHLFECLNYRRYLIHPGHHVPLTD